jgi:hypothetical protein
MLSLLCSRGCVDPLREAIEAAIPSLLKLGNMKPWVQPVAISLVEKLAGHSELYRSTTRTWLT